MNETYQNRITDQICKIQNDRALIAFYDRLRYAPLGNYAQLSNISPSEEPCRYYLLTGYIQGMLEALTMLTTVEDGKRFKIKLEQFRQNLLLSGDYDATGNYKQAVKKTAV